MTKKNDIFRKVLIIIFIPIIALYMLITGDKGEFAMFIRDIFKKDSY